MIKFKTILQFEQQILATMLLVYHILIWATPDPGFQFALVFVLYGLFLLWQPLWNRESQIRRLPIVGLTLALLLLPYFFPFESLVLFGLILSGLIGSRLFNQSGYRSFDLLALVIIILQMVTGVVPGAFAQIELPGIFASYIQTVVLVPILLFFFAPNPDMRKQRRSQVDLMHGLLTASLIFTVLLGAIVINVLYGVAYLDGFLLNVFLVSTLTLGISWFWNPGVGYSGLGVLWNRYAMTIGGPFETWINTLTTLIEDRFLTPSEFLEAACDHLIENDWLNAIQWDFDAYKVTTGDKTGFRLDYSIANKITANVYFKSAPGKALEQHTFLLVRMAFQFYLAKLNQEKIRTQEHFATIHHTGARLTHDMKNILQSIKTSLEILTMGEPSNRQQHLLQANLNQISTRLENTLEKLKAPRLDTQIKLIDARQWMNRLQRQHATDERLVFHNDIEQSPALPCDLFDGVIENLLSNALAKSSAQRIEVRLLTNAEVTVLSVCDDGEAVGSDIEEDLFKQPVSSGSGMGIGLYQCAIMARSFNFELALSQNENGRVCFNLLQQISD